MKHHNILVPVALLSLAVAVSTSCANDEDLVATSTAKLGLCSPANAYFTDDADAHGARILMRAPSYAPAYTDADLFVPGTGSGDDVSQVSKYLPYDKLYPSPINKTYTTIGAFLAQNSKDNYDALAGFFQWKSDNEWTTTVSIRPGDFYLFGYMPSNIGSINASISKRTDIADATWDDGAKMTIANLNTVTPADVCVVVGVLKATVPNPKPGDWSPLAIDHTDIVRELKQGVYGYHGTEEDNYVYLLLDHLYTNVNMELSVEKEYSKLRSIVLKEVFMKTPVRETVDATIILDNSATKPIKDIQFSAPTGGSPTKAQIFPALPEYQQVVAVEGDGVTSIPGYFAPGMTTQEFEFEFHYDVLDKEGNCVRKDCIAINKWKLPGTGVQNGKSFKVTATIRPTYLYMLSDPDLNNPTIVLDTNP